MTRRDFGEAAEGCKTLLGKDDDFITAGLRLHQQNVLQSEMTETLGAARGERAGGRSGDCRRSLVTRVGQLELRAPQDRDGRFSTEVSGRCRRSEKALVATLAKMCVQGVSTRRVRQVAKETCGLSFSVSTVPDIVRQLDGQPAAFAGRCI